MIKKISAAAIAVIMSASMMFTKLRQTLPMFLIRTQEKTSSIS